MDQSSSTPAGLLVSSPHTAVPRMNNCTGSPSPLPVGSEKSRATRPSRRTFSAFWGKPIEVVISSVPSCRRNGLVGHAIGVPSFASVANSQVRYASRTEWSIWSIIVTAPRVPDQQKRSLSNRYRSGDVARAIAITTPNFRKMPGQDLWDTGMPGHVPDLRVHTSTVILRVQSVISTSILYGGWLTVARVMAPHASLPGAGVLTVLLAVAGLI